MQVVAARALEFEQLLLVARGALRGHDDLGATGQVCAGNRVRVIHHLLWRAFGDDLPAMYAGTRADIHHIVGETDRVLVVLDHDHRIAEVAQMGEGAQQALVVALVQADRWLVEDVHHPDQAGADLAGQADTLRLATGEGIGAAIQGQIVQADVDQELQALADLLENLRRDLPATTGQAQALGIVAGFAHRHRSHCRQRLVANPHMSSLTAQAGAMAIRARLGAEELRQLLADGIRLGLAIAPLEVRQDALEGVGALDDIAAVVEVAEVDVLATGAAEHYLLMLGG
ncbi:MAG: hypothetical protein GAK45_02062 [Pseudomonas citronellolis]|nr:MAG: hypothetical protein GAK45_02062 [Pseudomonas citronellolis]